MPEQMKAAVAGRGDLVISEWRLLRRGSLTASLTIKTPSGLLIKNCCFFESGTNRWISFPSRAYKKADGSNGYSSYIDFENKALKDGFQRDALSALDEFLARGASDDNRSK
jgi:hypothetical protein